MARSPMPPKLPRLEPLADASALQLLEEAEPLLHLPPPALATWDAVSTPADAISSGASHIVVGRPVTAAADPAGAAMAILDEIDSQAG